MTYAHCDMSS